MSFLLVVLAIVAHELGHALVALGFGYDVRPVLTRTGMGLSYGVAKDEMPAEHLLLTALAGPLASVGYGLLMAALGEDAAALASFLVCTVNLLPLACSDGALAREALSRMERPRRTHRENPA